MSRFTIPERKGGKSAMRVIQKDSLLAFFDFIDTDTGLVYRDFKLCSGRNGLFVGSPSGTPYESNGVTKYPAYVQAAYDESESTKRSAAGDDWFAELTEVASAVYADLTDGQEAPPRRSSGAGRASGGASGSKARTSGGRQAAPATRTSAPATRRAPAGDDFEDFPGSLEDPDDDLPF